MKTANENKKGEIAAAACDASQVARLPLVSSRDFITWFKEQLPLVNCLFVALSLHVVLIPVLWIMGWALPWPRPPVITTVIEYDLTNWPRVAKPKKVFQLVDPDLN